MQRAQTAVDWPDWARRWEDQQLFHIPRREQRFQLMLELVGEIAGPEPTAILDLACGPGSISRRALNRFPRTRLVALDADPFLLEMGERTLGDAGGRLRWVRADLRGTEWVEQLREFAPFDAVLTATALHWLSASDLVHVYRGLAGLVRPGGVFFNAEHMMLARPTGRFGSVGKGLRLRLGRHEDGDGESWDQWWKAAQAEPAFAALLADRATVFDEIHPRHEEYIMADFHEEALKLAGFSETAVVFRYLDDTIVGGIR
ncbi:MAG: methyltransferase [Chloroflexi bacterium]|nr:methyltransferase [Chloroflexota bacterium]